MSDTAEEGLKATQEVRSQPEERCDFRRPRDKCGGTWESGFYSDLLWLQAVVAGEDQAEELLAPKSVSVKPAYAIADNICIGCTIFTC